MAEPIRAAAPTARDLSIVVQGRLAAADAGQTARHCRHWRTLFPEAEIVLAISGSDIVGREWPASPFSGDVEAGVAEALNVLADLVDAVAWAEPAEPLAPLKFGGAHNNVNLQIAAAKAGLAAVTRPYTLRIRADLTLAGPILEHYRSCVQSTPPAMLLSRRVMICHLFTLNPYTIERLPLHFSDWYQLGATADLRTMWDIGFYGSKDAAYYSTTPHARYSNPAERGFQSRYGAEQFIALSHFRRRDPGLVMDFHNDLVARRPAMDILFDNYVIADPAVCKVTFDKYGHVIDHPFSDLLCVGHDDWRHFAKAVRDDDYRTYFAAKAARLGPFPKGYD